MGTAAVGAAALGVAAGATSLVPNVNAAVIRAQPGPVTATASSSVLPSTWDMETDVLVAGAGLAGLAAALRAVQSGVKVLLVEAGQETGGCALFSGAILHTSSAVTLADYQKLDPLVDPVLGELQSVTFPQVLTWIRGMPSIPISTGSLGANSLDFGSGAATYADKREYCDGFNNLIEEGGGTILYGTSVVDLWQDPLTKTVIGARAALTGPAPANSSIGTSSINIKAKAVILCTGGFQNNKELLVRYFGQWADLAVARCQPYSGGSALLMGVKAGAKLSRGMGKGYGHTQAWPIVVPQTPATYEPFDKTFLYQIMSGNGIQALDGAGIYVNLYGNRYINEATNIFNAASNVLNYAHMLQPFARVFSIFDSSSALANSTAGKAMLAIQSQAGAVVLQATTIANLATALSTQFGVNPDNFVATVNAYNTAVAAGAQAAADLPVPRSAPLNPITTPPFYAIPATTGVTCTYGGLAIDTECHVLDTNSTPIPGLFASMGAAGGIYYDGYIGSLANVTVFGYLAGGSAANYAKSVAT